MVDDTLKRSDDLRWYHVTVCDGMDIRYFYDYYESDPVLAETMDSLCMSCPVRKMCLREGVENKEYGLWGGVYLNNGITDAAKNSHKTEEVWSDIRGDVVG